MKGLNLIQYKRQKNKSFLQSNIVTNTVHQNANIMNILSNLKKINLKTFCLGLILLFKYILGGWLFGSHNIRSSVEKRVMGVGNGGHGVDLEILVRSNNGHSFDWSPVGEGWLGIVEPLVGDSLQEMVVDVSNSLSNFSSGNSSSD